MKVLITGAAGNLGCLLARHLRDGHPELELLLMEHHKRVPPDLRGHPGIHIRPADLAKPGTLPGCLTGANVIVHFAGVLFRARPEKFLPTTNTLYFHNLLAAARKAGVPKVILISFPHVEGPSSPARPATGRLDGQPESVHAKTRLEEEKLLFQQIDNPISLRVGMVYGQGILMIDAAEWFAKHRLLGVWKKPTAIHLISKTDFCRAVAAAIISPAAQGTYHVGDEGQDTLQSFLDLACGAWGCRKPWRLPLGLIYLAAGLCEAASALFKTFSPLTRDFIDIGRVSYHGDTTRFRRELLPVLKYPTIAEGMEEMKY
ncbi:MAG: NAD(P)H-binding protein [Desulfobacteraceae bacterium]|nr:NAD(P)H-binding protein [Desulfobacteraceae bacterium]